MDIIFGTLITPTNAQPNNNYYGLATLSLLNDYQEIPEEYPFDLYNNNWYSIGTYNIPWDITASNCSQNIVVNQLNVDNGGGLVLQAGMNGYADLKPTAGNIIINNGGPRKR